VFPCTQCWELSVWKCQIWLTIIHFSDPGSSCPRMVGTGIVETDSVIEARVATTDANIEILHGRTHSSCHSNNVGKGYWSADRKCGGSHALLECSLLHALRFEFGG